MPLDPDTRHDSPSTERHLTQQTDDGTSTDGVSRDGNFADGNLPEMSESVTSAQSAHLDEPYDEERDPWNLEHSVAVSIGLDQPGIPVTPRSRDMDTDTEQGNTVDTLKYGIDRDGAVMLLEYMLSSGPKLGIFSLLHDLRFDIKSAIEHLGGSRARQGCAGLAYAVLAIGLEIYPYQSHQHLALNTDIAIDSLRAEFLSLIPTLAWKSADADISPCVSLLFASYTWCFTGNLTEISTRWIGIARLLWEELRTGEVPDWSTQFRNRITNAIHFQSILMSYLHFQEPPLPLSLQHNDTSCHSSSEGDEYFHLLSQLLGPFQQACKLDRQPANLRRVRDDLEEVYLGLPPHLLEFSDLEYAYQAEFLLWLHGIYIITYVNPDLYTVFTDSSLPLTREYFSTLEHTLLLGETPKAKQSAPAQ
ncbi:unnamed protein product [Fusarium equiseti]|uniref:Transcription factor domain-containing protein n=1 Tax=Fusarium equiseti TaxID=61235 RepID=A0A8J2IRK3_FUSEQ|nr:unnamed protein product [Fusarium equiseti]